MNKNIGYFVAFAAGAGIATFVTWRYAKSKYEQITKEEIESVKQVFSENIVKLREELTKTYEEKWDKKDVPELLQKEMVVPSPPDETYEQMLVTSGYTDESYCSLNDEPYVITPEHFGELEDYDTITLYYFRDGTLTDDDYDIVNDPDLVVGYESLDYIGVYEPDCVHVRNDKLKADYEILMDLRNYLDVNRGKQRSDNLEE